MFIGDGTFDDVTDSALRTAVPGFYGFTALAADFDGDRRDELLITSPWGIGVLAWTGGTIDSLMLKPNGTRFGGWLLNTADNQFRSFQNMTGAGRADILVESPWGIGLMTLQNASFAVPVMAPNGTRFGNWLLNTHDNWF